MHTVTELKEGLLLIDKPQGRTSFSLIRALTKITKIKKIGHAGTLDPFATGVMVMLIGRKYTRISNELLFQDKEYFAVAQLGMTTDSYDCDGKIVGTSKKIPSQQEIDEAIALFQGEIQQIPPMFSAKKINGRKLYTYARKGEIIDRKPSSVNINIDCVSYMYPEIRFRVSCTKGTYIRSLAHEIGIVLGCGAHLKELKRLKSGNFCIKDCIDGNLLNIPDFDVTPYLRSLPDGETF
ncbi:MAG: tRNA pseudouridine(55) synthase TruB [Victivallaceae bacterium]